MNVDRAKQGMELHDTLQFLIGSLEQDTDNLQTSDPIDTEWRIIKMALQEWVWRNTAVCYSE